MGEVQTLIYYFTLWLAVRSFKLAPYLWLVLVFLCLFTKLFFVENVANVSA